MGAVPDVPTNDDSAAYWEAPEPAVQRRVACCPFTVAHAPVGALACPFTDSDHPPLAEP